MYTNESIQISKGGRSPPITLHQSLRGGRGVYYLAFWTLLLTKCWWMSLPITPQPIPRLRDCGDSSLWISISRIYCWYLTMCAGWCRDDDGVLRVLKRRWIFFSVDWFSFPFHFHPYIKWLLRRYYSMREARSWRLQHLSSRTIFTNSSYRLHFKMLSKPILPNLHQFLLSHCLYIPT